MAGRYSKFLKQVGRAWSEVATQARDLGSGSLTKSSCNAEIRSGLQIPVQRAQSIHVACRVCQDVHHIISGSSTCQIRSSLSRRDSAIGQKMQKAQMALRQGGLRTKFTDNKGRTHFRPRGYAAFQAAEEGIQFQSWKLWLGGGAGLVLVLVYVAGRQEVPYTHRKHFVLVSSQQERALGKASFEQIKESFKGRIYPPNHPYVIRVQSIVAPIIQAALVGVPVATRPASLPSEARHVKALTSTRNAFAIVGSSVVKTLRLRSPVDEKPVRDAFPGDGPSSETKDSAEDPFSDWFKGFDDNGEGKKEVSLETAQPEEVGVLKVEGAVSSAQTGDGGGDMDHELMDDGTYGTPDSGGGGGYLKHLEGLDWEVIVVKDDMVNAFALPGGKICVYTGLLKKFDDGGLATVLAHEVSHIVARHGAEKLSQQFGLLLAQILVAQVFGVSYDILNMGSSLLLTLPFSRKMESEADRIGLLLMASAGFDPRVAPKLYLELDQHEKKLGQGFEYASTHPSGTKRAKALAQTHVMQEAYRLYRKKKVEQARKRLDAQYFTQES